MIPVSTVLTVISICVAIGSFCVALYFNSKNYRTRAQQRAEQQGAVDGQVALKLETMNTSLIELKSDLRGYREEVQRLTEMNIRADESMKSIIQRLNRVEEQLTQIQQHIPLTTAE